MIGREGKGVGILLSLLNERNMVFPTHADRFLGLSGDRACRQADLKSLQMEIILQIVGAPVGQKLNLSS